MIELTLNIYANPRGFAYAKFLLSQGLRHFADGKAYFTKQNGEKAEIAVVVDTDSTSYESVRQVLEKGLKDYAHSRAWLTIPNASWFEESEYLANLNNEMEL